MATLNFNGLTFSYDPAPLSLKRLVHSHQENNTEHYDQKLNAPVIVPLCTAKLAEEASLWASDEHIVD